MSEKYEDEFPMIGKPSYPIGTVFPTGDQEIDRWFTNHTNPAFYSDSYLI